MTKSRIYLSPPNVGKEESEILTEVIKCGWISSVGPSLTAFESDLESMYSKRVLALNSGTSALHLALILSNVKRGDTVLVSSFTFAACANVILYQGAIPVFIDSESKTWNLDPILLEEYINGANSKPKAVIVTHLYGVPAKMLEIKRVCDEYEIILIEDAAEAVGATLHEKQLGSFGDFGILSFNGNKIITTSGGGALITNKKGYNTGLHLSTQANSGQLDYFHKEVGYNYRMSNVLAGVGIVQLSKLKKFVGRKREIFDCYQDKLSTWFEFPLEPKNAFCNRWLTTPLAKGNVDVVKLVSFLDQNGIESRRLWRPLHLHPAYDQYEFVGDGVAENLYEVGICLPSGTGLSQNEQDFVIEKISSFCQAN